MVIKESSLQYLWMKQRESFMKNIQSELSLTTTMTTARMVRICLRWTKWITINYIVVFHGDDKDELYQEIGGKSNMDSRFFERKCFVTTSESLLKFMQEQEDDSSLTFNMEKDTKEIFLYSPAYDVEYNEDDIIERVSNELNVEINNIFVDGDKYCAAIYFTVKKLEQ